MERHWIVPVHIDALRHTADRSLRLVVLALEELNGSFQVEGFDERRLPQDLTCGLFGKRLRQLWVRLVSFGQNAIKVLNGPRILLHFEVDERKVIEQLRSVCMTAKLFPLIQLIQERDGTFEQAQRIIKVLLLEVDAAFV